MFDFIRSHTRILFFVLILLIIPSFVLFGVDGYQQMRAEGNQDVATVDGRGISAAEWDAAHRQQVERVRAQMPNLDAALFDTPEAKKQTLDELVRERVMLAAADKLHLMTSDARLQRLFATDPQFAQIRNPDGSISNEFLLARGMTSQQFAETLRRNLSLQQVLQGVAGSALASDAAAAGAMDALFQQREITVQRFDPKDFATTLTPSDAELQKHYDDPANAALYRAPEEATIEYVVLDGEALKAGITVSDDELRKYYAENEARYTSAQERRASHILIKAEKDAPADQRAKAKAKAEALLAEIRKNPAAFAELAKKNSDDPGSAEKGGDLDFFGRGAMVKPFEDAAYAMQPGEVSNVVETDFGYHLIKLDAVRGGTKKSFDEVRAEITEEFRKQAAARKFAEAATDFGNLVYEQADSLQPAADKYKLKLIKAEGVQRTPKPGAAGPLASAKFLEALFAADSLRTKRNTEAVDTGANVLASGRIVEHRPARQIPFAEVKDRVRQAVVAEQAAALARKQGEQRLAALKAAPATAMDGSPRSVSRAQAGDQPREVVEAALKADAATLPAFVGVDLGSRGYAVVRIGKVLGRDPAVADPVQTRTLYARAWSAAEGDAYYASLKDRFKVKLKPAAQAASQPG
jgi:peptidyl-prolyl cis-trans isomerase D